MTKLKNFLKEYSEQAYLLAILMGMLSFSWFNWDEKCKTFLLYFDYVRYGLTFILLSIRYLYLLFYERKFFIKVFILLIPFIITVFTANTIFLIQFVFFIFASYKVDFNKILKALLFSFLFSFIVFIFNLLIKNITIIWDYNGGRYRSFMGFIHPNYFAVHVMSFTLLLWYLSKNRDKFYWILVCFAISIFLWLYPNARTQSIVLTFVPITNCVLKWIFGNENKIINVLLILVPLFLLALTYILVFNCELLDPSNSFSSRFYIGNYHLKEYGIHLFLSSRYWCDNIFLFLPMHFGIVCTVLYICLFMSSIQKAISNKEYAILSICIVMLIYGIMTNDSLNPRFNISLFYLLSNSSCFFINEV